MSAAAIAALCMQLSGIEVAPEADLLASGLNSLHLLRLTSALSQQTGRTVRQADLFDHPTCIGLADYLAGPAQG